MNYSLFLVQSLQGKSQLTDMTDGASHWEGAASLARHNWHCLQIAENNNKTVNDKNTARK